MFPRSRFIAYFSLSGSLFQIIPTVSTHSHQFKKKGGKRTNSPTHPFNTYIDSHKHELVQHAHEPHNFSFTQNFPSRALAFPTRQQCQQQKQQPAQTLPRPLYKGPPTVSWNGPSIRRNVSHGSNHPSTLSPYRVVQYWQKGCGCCA